MSHSEFDSFNQRGLGKWSQIKVQVEYSHEVLSVLYESVLLLRNQFTANKIGEELWHKITSKVLNVFHEKYDEVIMIIRQYTSDILKMTAHLGTITMNISSVVYEGLILLNKRSQYQSHDQLILWSIRAFRNFNRLVRCIERCMKLSFKTELDLKTTDDLEDSMPSNSICWIHELNVLFEQIYESDSVFLPISGSTVL